MGDENPLYVTKPALPPLAELLPALEEIWNSRHLTNSGQYHRRFEAALCEHLGVEHLTLVANATLGLTLALRQLGLTGEVITTPFTFVATGHALLWAGLKPVFVDIDPHTLNLDPAQIAAALTKDTTAILPVHCFGHACDVTAIDAIAQARGLKVVYDAAHAFGVRQHTRSVVLEGDLSVLSFHATKVFNTFEGGAIISRDAETKAALDRLTNYGIVDENHVDAVGTNAKMSEFNAAVGLLQLTRVDADIEGRCAVDAHYRQLLSDIPGLRCMGAVDGETSNYAYFPVLIEPAYPMSRDALYEKLKRHGVHARRYFHPLLVDLPMYRSGKKPVPHLPHARAVSAQVLCLPMYPDLAPDDQMRIADLIRFP